MDQIISEIKGDYEGFHLIEKNSYGGWYKGIDTKINKNVCLKIYCIKLLEKGKKDFLLKQIEREVELTKLCKSEYILELYERIDIKDAIILKYESFESNLFDYLYSNGELKNNKNFFKKVVKNIAKALKVLLEKGVIHRDIKPSNIFLTDNDKIKLGNFNSSILISENDFKQIGTILYTAPEMFKNIKYNEKVDLWSLGISLYYLYFGISPYGYNVNINLIKHSLYSKKWIYLFSNNPNLDILFKKLMTINPNERISHEELLNYVSNDDFMNQKIIYINNQKNKYEKIYNEIEIIKKSEKYEILLKEPDPRIIKEINDPEERFKVNLKKIIDIVSVDNIPGLMNFSRGDISEDVIIKYNNIVYYDENIEDYLHEIHEDSYLFEKNTQGAFLLCTNIDSLGLLMKEISKECSEDKQIEFNLIVTGSKCTKVMEYLTKKDYEQYFKNICIYCMNIDDHSYLQDIYPKIYNIYNDPDDVVEYIKKFSSNKIKPFRVTKLVTYDEYNLYYFAWHKKIAEFYGDLNPETYKIYIEKIENYINEEDVINLKLKNKAKLIASFKKFSFDLTEDLRELDKKIINEYSKESYYGDINKWLLNYTINSFEEVSYFTSRLMHSLNSYANTNQKYCNDNEKKLFRGANISYSSLLAYERAIGKIIVLSAFTSSSESLSFVENWAGRNDGDKIYDGTFSVIYYITNKWENNWISNGIDIQDIAQFDEKEVLFQPFSFYYVEKVEFDLNKYYADIYLHTIGKTEILEDAIHNGKKIEYNDNLDIIQVKN